MTSQSFEPAGAEPFIIDVGLTDEIGFELEGAAGADSVGDGGLGGKVTGTADVSDETILRLFVADGPESKFRAGQTGAGAGGAVTLLETESGELIAAADGGGGGGAAVIPGGGGSRGGTSASTDGDAEGEGFGGDGGDPGEDGEDGGGEVNPVFVDDATVEEGEHFFASGTAELTGFAEVEAWSVAGHRLDAEPVTVTHDTLVLSALVPADGDASLLDSEPLDVWRDLAATPDLEELEQGRGRWRNESWDDPIPVTAPPSISPIVESLSLWFVVDVEEEQVGRGLYDVRLELRRQGPRESSLDVDASDLDAGDDWELSVRDETLSLREDQFGATTATGSPAGKEIDVVVDDLTPTQAAWLLDRLPRPGAIVEREVDGDVGAVVDTTRGGQSVVMFTPDNADVENDIYGVSEITVEQTTPTVWTATLGLRRLTSAIKESPKTFGPTGDDPETVDVEDATVIDVDLEGSAGENGVTEANDIVPGGFGGGVSARLQVADYDDVTLFVADGSESVHDGGESIGGDGGAVTLLEAGDGTLLAAADGGGGAASYVADDGRGGNDYPGGGGSRGGEGGEGETGTADPGEGDGFGGDGGDVVDDEPRPAGDGGGEADEAAALTSTVEEGVNDSRDGFAKLRVVI